MRWAVMLLALAATQPATRQSEVADLRRIIADLQRQVATLKAENVKLAKQVATTQKTLPPSTRRVAGAIKVGDKFEDMTPLMASYKMLYEDASGRQEYEWSVDGGRVLYQGWVENGVLMSARETYRYDQQGGPFRR